MRVSFSSKPHSTDAEVRDAGSVETGAMTGSSFKILLAEDEKVQAVWLQNLLEEYGYSVHCVHNGRQALDILNRDHFPIVMTDLIMPDMNGIELCRSIRRLRFSNYIYIIIITGKEGKEELISGINAGADDFMNKPVDAKELFARLKTARRILDMERTLLKQYREISLLSITDPLTKAYNRRYFMEQLQSEMARCARYSHALTIILCDIDKFKEVNDTYGHQLGDLVLQEFANALNLGIRREVDCVARYGGEEFILVLPETDTENACICSERLRQEVSDLRFPSDSGFFGITASFGTVTVLGNRKTPYPEMDVLLKAADVNLYEAKTQGRDRCVCSKI